MLLAHAHAFIPARHLARQKNTLVASMPDGLEAWGCDDLLWTQIPPGAKRVKSRFAPGGIWLQSMSSQPHASRPSGIDAMGARRGRER